MTEQEIRTELQRIADAGSDGIIIRGAYTEGEKHLVDTGHAYMPLNPFRAFGSVNRLRLTTKGRTFLKNAVDLPGPVNDPPATEPDPTPDPAPAPTPEPDPDPAPPVDPEPPAPEPEVPPVPEAPPVERDYRFGPVAHVPTPASLFVEHVRALTQVPGDMNQLATALRPVAAELRATGQGWDGVTKRQVLQLTPRNANKWAAAPARYALMGVDE